MKTKTEVPSYNDLIQKIHDLLKEEIQGLPLLSYPEMLRDLRGKPPIQGVYLIFDAEGRSIYVGKGQDVRTRLLDHARIKGDLVYRLMAEEGFSYEAQKAHRCECGKLIECGRGPEKIEDGREQAAERLQAWLLKNYKVSILSYTLASTLPLGLRELERLAQYILVPIVGKISHRTKGQIPISEHVEDNPIPKDIKKDLELPKAAEVRSEETESEEDGE